MMTKKLLASLAFLFVVPGLIFTVSCSKHVSGSGPGVTAKSGPTTGTHVAVSPYGASKEYRHFAATQPFPDENVHFKYDSYRLLVQARENLREKAQWLLAHPEVSVVIEGHCDERGMDAYNLALGDQRAKRVKEYLISLGVSPERLATISYGEEHPIDPRHSEEAWAKNRRAQFK